MLAILSALGGALAVVGAAAWWLLRGRAIANARAIAIVAGAMWLTSMSVVAWLLEGEPQTEEMLGRSPLVQSLDSLAWPDPARSPAVQPQVPATAQSSAMQAASVESLVAGLESRLAAQPNDAEGWALLAQSYSYTANAEAVERAVQRAVALGVDEQSLRQRVGHAQRSAPGFDRVDRPAGERRP
jgi:cytochrome c-type biogenesis protein CcmH/NrfG